MERITQKHLEGVLKRINAKAGFENPKYSEVDSYTLDYSYGGVKLEQYCNEGGGVRNITYGFDTKRNTYNLMHAYLMGMESNAVNCHDELMLVKKHAEFLEQAVKSWFTKIGQKEPSYPSSITFCQGGLQEALYKVEQALSKAKGGE